MAFPGVGSEAVLSAFQPEKASERQPVLLQVLDEFGFPLLEGPPIRGIGEGLRLGRCREKKEQPLH